MEHELDVIDRTVAKTHEWLRRVSEGTGIVDRHRSYQVLRAVLHAMRDRVAPDVAAHVAAQLPLLVRGIFYEGWDPAKTPVKMSFAQFLGRIEREANLKGAEEAEGAARAVMGVCWDELGDGTMDHLASVLPREYAVVM